MKRKFHPYWEWEDYQSGMYDELKDGREQRVFIAINLLNDCQTLNKFMREIPVRWKTASEQVFTNKGCNRKAWLGQAACHLYAGVKEDETREAWGHLTEEQREQANGVAAKIIREWEQEYEKNARCQCI